MQKLKKNKDIVLLSTDKRSCPKTLNKNEHVCKVDKMNEDGITEIRYTETTGNTLRDVKRFQDFLCRHFYKHKDYEVMILCPYQPVRFFATAKTHNFQYIEDISLGSLKLRPIN